MQLQAVFDHLATLLVRLAPAIALELARHQALHIGRLAQAQQVGLVALFQSEQDAFVAVARIATHQRRALFSQLVEQMAQRRLHVGAAVLLA